MRGVVLVETALCGQNQRIFIIGKLGGWPVLKGYEMSFAPGELFGVQDRCSRMFSGRAGPLDGLLLQAAERNAAVAGC